MPSAQEVGSDFRPYDTGGHWDYDGSDYVWVSDYAWGWVCFHYGRWVYDPGLCRWLWIAGRDYAPAWVDWQLGEEGYPYIGWAPMGPSWLWIGGVAVGVGAPSAAQAVFTTIGDLFAPDEHAHVLTGSAAVSAAGHSRPYVSATPRVGPSRAFATPAPHGPALALLGLDPARVPRGALSERELRARKLARPSTAVALGAHPPSPHVVRAAPSRVAVPRGGTGPGHAAGRGRR